MTLSDTTARHEARSTQPTGDTQEKQRILASLDITLPRTAVSRGYAMAMGLLALWLASIPFVYLALVAFLAYLVIWHLFETFATAPDGPYFLFHLPMAFLGGLLLLFLIKPVFLRRRIKPQGIIALTEAEEPLLYAYVRKLCRATGSRPPTSIEVDCDANAHARLRRGIVSVIRGDLVLRIGLPLAAELNLRQFTGVLALEFGHFNQRHGMSGSYLIRRLTTFFGQIVFQRDKLDFRLARQKHSINVLRRGMYWTLLGPIEAARGVLWLMLLAGELLSRGVMRRMEYDADRLEALVAGTRDFIATSQKLVFLSLGTRISHADLMETWEQRRLADDLPKLIVSNGRYFSESRPDILKRVESQKTRWFDTHPSQGDRIRHVELLGSAGLMNGDGIAGNLFSDFDALCRRATQSFYRGNLGEKATEAAFIPTATFAGERVDQRQAYRALRRFFRGHVVPMRPVFPDSDADRPADRPQQAVADLRIARQAMLQASAAIGSDSTRYGRDVAVMAASRAEMALCGIMSRSPQAARLHARASRTLRKAQTRHATVREKYEPFTEVARQRLTAALRLLQSDGLPNPRAGGGEAYLSALRARSAELIGVCRALEPCVEPMNKLRELAITLRVLTPSYNPRNPHPLLVKRILQASHEAADILRQLWRDLSVVPFPFKHAPAGTSIGGVLVPAFPDQRSPAETHAASVTALDAFSLVVIQTLAELTLHAEKVEDTVDLEALPELDEQEIDKETGARGIAWKYWLGYGVRAVMGVSMFVWLVWISINPPVLMLPWISDVPGGYQPNSFHVPFTPPPPPVQYGQPFAPRNGATPQPFRPAAPLRPGTPRAPGQPGRPGTPWYQPSSPSGGGHYAPGGGGYGGGGGSHGGGGGGGRH